LPVDGIPGAYLLVSATPVSRMRKLMPAVRDVMPSPGLVVLVVLSIIATPFLLIFLIASVLAMIKGGLGF
jgi:phosphatidylserine synthase